MGKSAPKMPTPPNASTVIGASQGANADTAALQAKLNNNNYRGPDGNVNWTNNGDNQWTQNVQLAPNLQEAFDWQTKDTAAANKIAYDQLGRINNAVSSSVGAPQLQTSVGQGNIQQGYASPDRPLSYNTPTQTLRNTYDPGGPIQGQIGNANLGSAVKDAQSAAYSQATSRLDPQYAQQEEQLKAQMAAQGLGANSTAYQTEMANFGRAKTDAYNQANYSAIQAGNNEQNVLFGQQAAQGQFANAAQQQGFGQNQQQFSDYNNATLGQFGQDLQARQFGNSAVAQGDAQNQSHAAFANTAEQQQYNQGLQSGNFYNSTANQNFQNQAYAQNLPINQTSALMGLGQVSMPTSQQGNTSVAPTDVTGAYGLQTQAQQAQYQAQMANYQSGMGGLMSLGGAALKAAPMFLSDIRMKRDVTKLADHPDGYGVYRFRYHGHDGFHVGVMAQEVQAIRPDAIHEIGGILHVDYGRLAA